VIFGCASTILSPEERSFFARVNPLGFILFSRNIVAPGQVKALTETLREVVGRHDAPILIDQEGGRIQRLQPPQWRASPAAASLGRLALADRGGALEAARLSGRLIASELTKLGIDVDCAPVLDLRLPGAHDVIGDRAFSGDPDLVAALGRALAEGLGAGGVLPVAKHIPGHGRAKSDSHVALPVVDADEAELSRTDFAPFKALNDLPWAMTAHVIYSAIDPAEPATTSSTVVRNIIRGTIGFDGLLLSDDLSMEALRGDLGARARASLGAGCDVVMHCNGRMDEMAAVAAAAAPLSDAAVERLGRSRAWLAGRRPVDVAQAEPRLAALLQS
jgi:beta-N-acetylhexosaminidase